VLRQRRDQKQFVIYYASKTRDEAQMKYSIMEKEMLPIAFALEKFRSCPLGFKGVVFTNQSTLKNLMQKMLSQGWFEGCFSFKNSHSKFKTKRVMEMLWLITSPNHPLIKHKMERALCALMALSGISTSLPWPYPIPPWYVDLVNYLICGICGPRLELQ